MSWALTFLCGCGLCLQVVGQMQTGAGGASRQPQSNVNLLPGLQALLGQQASSMAGSLPGEQPEYLIRVSEPPSI